MPVLSKVSLKLFTVAGEGAKFLLPELQELELFCRKVQTAKV